MTENLLFALIVFILAMVSRGIYVLTGVIVGLKYLYVSTEENKGQILVLKRQATEGLVLLLLIAGLSLVMFLFTH